MEKEDTKEKEETHKKKTLEVQLMNLLILKPISFCCQPIPGQMHVSGSELLPAQALTPKSMIALQSATPPPRPLRQLQL